MDKIHEYKKTTIRESISFVGVGLHTGKVARVTIKPSVDSRGIFFVRTDVAADTNIIDATWYNVINTDLSTDLSNAHGITVKTVEHLMSALSACGIDNVRIEIDGPELPIMDGSAGAYAQTIRNAGTCYLNTVKRATWITQPISVTSGDKYAMLLPHPVQRVTMCIDYPNTAIGSQCYSVSMEGDNYFDGVAFARTFGFSDQVEALKKRGMIQGGSLINAVLVDGEKVVNPEGLRVYNEFVRHKVLDAIGDLSLSGAPIMGYYYGYKSGHALNQQLLQKLFETTESWENLPLEQGQKKFSYLDKCYADDYVQQTLNGMKKVAYN
ncbi:MAG: UDP-3-O-acyl-N-acetylglucosamine deacetylase [Thiohalomonadales bacterium]